MLHENTNITMNTSNIKRSHFMHVIILSMFSRPSSISSLHQELLSATKCFIKLNQMCCCVSFTNPSMPGGFEEKTEINQ